MKNIKRTSLILLALVLFLVILVAVVWNFNTSTDVSDPTAVVIVVTSTTTPVPFLPTDVPEETVTPYPTGTPEGFVASPTPIPLPTLVVFNIPDDLAVVTVSKQVGDGSNNSDGLWLRSDPGYECDGTGDYHCNIEYLVYHPEIFILFDVDETSEWCLVTRNEEFGNYWTYCEYLEPTFPESCEIARELTEHLDYTVCEE